MKLASECHIVREGNVVELSSPAFVYRLDISDGLRAEGWTNCLTGRELPVGNNPEVELELDAADQRIFITGWRRTASQVGAAEPDQEDGYLKGWAAADFDDSGWTGTVTPVEPFAADRPIYHDYSWARTHVFVPKSAEGKSISLVLGSRGLSDFRYTRVFVNGYPVGTRRAVKRWNEPGVFTLDPKSKAYQHLRFGQDNVLALQLSGLMTRTQRLDQVDPQRAYTLTPRCMGTAQYEQYLVAGKPTRIPRLRVTEVRTVGDGDVTFTLRADRPAVEVQVVYRWNAQEPLLRRSIEVKNLGRSAVRLMNVRLGTYTANCPVSEGEQGCPVYIDGQFFVTVAHPAGWATGQDGVVSVDQYPGQCLAPGQVFWCMDTVLGVSEAGAARSGFLNYVSSRMRRVVRGHDHAYAIFESFGSWPGGDFHGVTEDYVLTQIAKVAEAERDTGCHFDLYSIEFWVDHSGDLERADPRRFPHGFRNITRELRKLGTDLALWIDGSMSHWSIGGNPVVHPTITHDGAYGAGGPTLLCRATDPIKTMYSTAFIHHLRENGVRLIKFDGNATVCYNPNHNHLPGLYSTEAIHNALIGTLTDLDRECPDVFLILYWGLRSPWWLLYGDTLFEAGLFIEAATPRSTPALYARDSVTIGLDQAQRWCEDLPPLGKDSLGVWLSDWGWNSSVGKERWQEGFVMDMCRGSLLAQPWADENWLTPREREQMSDFIALLRERSDCFRNPRFVLGDPWKEEPYGYCCTNGERAFVAINNASWADASVRLELGPGWGLPRDRAWDIYRWYPTPARLAAGVVGSVPIALRPFQVVLLEVVVVGTAPSLSRKFQDVPLVEHFAEPSRALAVSVDVGDSSRALKVPLEADGGELPPRRVLDIRCEVAASQYGGMLMVGLKMRRGGLVFQMGDVGRHFAGEGTVDGQPAVCQPILGAWTYPAPWQGWRMPIVASDNVRQAVATVSVMIPEDVEIAGRVYFIPD